MNFSKAMKMAVIIFTGAIAAAGLTACGGTKTAADSPSKGGVKSASSRRLPAGRRRTASPRRKESVWL